jgi:hypothetical protein
MQTMRSKGITILSITEITLGIIGLIFAALAGIKGLILYEPETTNASVGFLFLAGISGLILQFI